MKHSWEIRPLREVSSITYGYTESASDQQIGPKFLRITDIQNERVQWDSVPYCRIDAAEATKYRLDSGDIVFARTGATTGKSFLVENPPNSVFASYLIRLRIQNGRLQPRFVWFFFQTDAYWNAVEEGSTGSAQGGFNATKLGNLAIPIPPIEEQRRIVGILDKAFAAIATAKANSERNVQNARALFNAYLDDLFGRPGPDWEEKRLGDICQRVSVGHVGPTSNFYCSAEEGVPFVRSQNVRPGTLDRRGITYITKDFHNRLKKSQLRGGDLLFVRVGANRADCCCVPPGTGDLNCANVVFARPSGVNSSYIQRFCESPTGRARLLGMTTGAAQGVINTSSVAQLTIPIAPTAEQTKVVENIAEFSKFTHEIVSNNERKLSALDNLKQSLLQRGFSGAL